MTAISKIQYFLFIGLAVILYSCQKEDKYPVIPTLEYVNFLKISDGLGIDNYGKLILSFKDGDGDIGLESGDTFPPFDKSSEYYYNFFIKYFEMQKGVLKEIVLPISFNSRIPLVTPTGRNKSISGEIELEMVFNNPFSNYDTILFESYIVDRALNHSNSVRTPYIIVKKH